MDSYNILTKVYSCGHEAFTAVPKEKWGPTQEDAVHFSCKCPNCDFPHLLQRFRRFNNPSNKLVLATATLLAYDMFDSRQCLSVENIDALLRHWMRAIQCQISGESKHQALFDGLARSVADQDGPLAGKEMRALLQSGYLKFIKQSTIKIPTISALSRPGSAASISQVMSPISPIPTPRRLSSTSYVSSPLTHKPTGLSIIDPLEVVEERSDTADECESEEEEEEDEDEDRLRAALLRLHGVAKEMSWTTTWGDRRAEAGVIESFCDDLKHEATISAQISTKKPTMT
ncbi:hypothetical protein F5Y18DRAFT_417184 [Xylariaceae sp. FL1019]|nr:hypothetical protein F5Y18DRAFT_417184 [Xylariaceae sp. FL1019]